MHLCSVCEKIDFLDLPSLPAYYARGSYTHPWGNLVKYLHIRLYNNSRASVQDLKAGEFAQEFTHEIGLRHHQSLEELRAAATECAICKLIERGVTSCIAQLEEAGRDKTYAYYKEKRRYDDLEYKFSLVKRTGDGHGLMVLSLSKGINPWLLAGIGFCVQDEDALAPIVRGRNIEKNAGSDKTIERALQWVKECTTQHSGRCAVQDVELPLRVLDVQASSTPSKLRLYESNGELGQYIALSHVWGNNTHFMTTHSNIDAHKESISFDALPKTHQDAVTLTRKLGIRYLWIDSLCICQNDGPEWERESAKMHSIYANAYLTIAATGTAHDYDGFLTKRPDVEYTQFPYTSKDGQKGTLNAFSIPPKYVANPSDYTSLSNEPLTKRGWALQERSLSPRILHFASDQMCYECYHHFISEDGLRVQGRSSGIHEDWVPTAESGIPYRGSWAWHQMLRAYYPRALTKRSDKLPAVSGIAKTIEERTGDTYVAGLWRSQMIEGLIWQSMGSHSGKTSRPPEYRAPTWSWASIDGPFGNLGLGKGPEPRASTWKDVAIVEDCRVELQGENPYGEVKSAWLKMRAPLERLIPSEEKEANWETVPHKMAFRVRTKTGVPFGAYCMFDVAIEHEVAREMTLYALVLVRMMGKDGEEVEESCHQALIVSPVEGRPDTYERVGKILMGIEELGERDWLEDESKFATVTLV
ncbi:HET-domain-containing protein [Amniculicola lignicola CBS 123094]|uniref:HET-domain-containing protein n=1 Tax=Amniculicola lignicola CBS 123094 TaxID=1392246 RepID=A0A6A5WYD4_9PLEO|nr:HET-domain-containing protein [Amniculicola lignicola CBS 123094]